MKLEFVNIAIKSSFASGWRIFLPLAAIVLAAACSTTRNIPSGEKLYTGVETITYTDEDSIMVDDDIYDAVEDAFACPPNNALLGSSRVRTPLPVGLWVYNATVNGKGAFNNLLMRLMGKKPILISAVKPELRTRIAANILHDNGYFANAVKYSLIPDKKDSLKAKIRYEVTFNEPWLLDSIEYRRLQNRSDTLLQLREEERLLHRGDIFSTQLLEDERQRIASVIRNHGYYYFLPEYITYQADSTIESHRVWLKIGLNQDVPRSILKPWKIGKVMYALNGYDGETPTDSIHYKDIIIYYEGKLRVKPSVLYEQLKFKQGDLYSLDRHTQTQESLSRLNVFRYARFRYMPADTLGVSDVLDLYINTSYDYPLSGAFDVRTTVNDNDFAGPGVSLNLTRSNMFGGGESLSASLFGSYEWYTGRGLGSINNYEFGANATLTIPRLVLPRIGKRAYDFDANTRIDLNISQLNRAKYYSMLSFGGGLSYDFQPYAIRHHTFTPLRLIFNKLQNTTERFNSVVQDNPSLMQSLQNQFIPAIEYEYTLDNSSVRAERSKTIWRFSVAEAGNLISGAYALFGKGLEENKKFLGNSYSQFIKVSTELRYNHYISRNQRLATRIGGGVIYSYGNSLVAPYNERFYVGGANSIRAFTIRSVGPGHFAPDPDNPYSYIDQNGDLKIEGNIEYRLRMVGNLETALFLDAGNVWLLRRDATRPEGTLRPNRLLDDVALGSGIGFRYIMDMLIFRLDVGYALHFPYDTGVKRYFNTPSFADALGFHLALGYPF